MGKQYLDCFMFHYLLVPYIDKVLDVPKGEKCCIIGTVYLELTHKPSIFDDLNAEVV